MTTPTFEELSELAFWKDWQDRVMASLPNFCADKIYVDQDSIPEEDFRRVAKEVQLMQNWTDLAGRNRDKEFGARTVDTPEFGDVTRMWLDSCIETDFLRRNLLQRGWMEDYEILDIGAGYGRLAVALNSLLLSCTCVDAVPISTEICRHYCHRFAPDVKVLALDEFLAGADDLRFDMAINVHSWSECSVEQTRRWVKLLKEMKVRWLFTVVHGTKRGGDAYMTWQDPRESFRPAIEESYRLVFEEHLGLSNHPHALWHLR
jgi:SAM-dependent methyltransferase